MISVKEIDKPRNGGNGLLKAPQILDKKESIPIKETKQVEEEESDSDEDDYNAHVSSDDAHENLSGRKTIKVIDMDLRQLSKNIRSTVNDNDQFSPAKQFQPSRN